MPRLQVAVPLRFALQSCLPATVVALASTLAFTPALAQPVEPAYMPGRLLVMPRAGLPDAALDKILKENGNGRARRVGLSTLRIVDLPPGLEKKSLEKLARHPHIEFAELDQRVAPAAAPNDPYYGSAWHLQRIGAAQAWEASAGGGVTIAILDTGVDGNHPDLSSRMVAGWNFVDNSANTADVNGHGTAVAGAAAATLNNGVGVAAVAGQARIMPVRIADANAYAYWSTVAQGLTWAADKGARVANVSYVGVAGSSSVRSAAQYMKDRGGLVIVAAGNNNRDEGISPTGTMIPVSATDTSDRKTSFSSWGNFVALSAPGIDVWTTQRGGSYGRWWGTSIASPVTAGVVALMMARNPSLTAPEIESRLYASALDLGVAGRDPVFGHGRVDAEAAVLAAAGPGAPVDKVAPTVAITSPGADGTVSGLVAIDTASSDDTGVTRVELRVNDALVATDMSPPFRFSWDSTRAANGMNTLVAVAFDAAGNSASSGSVPVNVANVVAADTTPPSLSIANPADGATVSRTVTVSVTASDDSGSAGISQTLSIDGRVVAAGTGGSLQYRWNTRKVAKGTHTIQATARDAAGNTTTRTVTVRH